MSERRIKNAVADLAETVGAELPPRRGRFLEMLVGRWKRRADTGSALAAFDTAAGRPRDLDNPFSDPDVQRRVGAALAQKARSRKRGR